MRRDSRLPTIPAMRADLEVLEKAAKKGRLEAVAANRLPSFKGFRHAPEPPPVPVLAEVGGPVEETRPERPRGPLVGSIVILLLVAVMVKAKAVLLHSLLSSG